LHQKIIMKSFITTLFCGFLLIFTACDGLNKELLSQIEQKSSEYSQTMPDFENTLKGISALSTQLATTPEALKSDPVLGAEYGNINDKVSALGMRCNAMKSEFEDLNNKLKTLVGDYSSGKLKTAAVKTEFQTICTGMDELKTMYTKNSEGFGNVSAMYGKMMATYNSKLEAK
jgi:hypothetical protein